MKTPARVVPTLALLVACSSAPTTEGAASSSGGGGSSSGSTGGSGGNGGEGGLGGEGSPSSSGHGGGEAWCVGGLYLCRQCLAPAQECGHRDTTTGAWTEGTCDEALACDPPCPDPSCPP